jgi:hypothetical protein
MLIVKVICPSWFVIFVGKSILRDVSVVLWIRIRFNMDTERAFYLNADPDPDPLH